MTATVTNINSHKIDKLASEVVHMITDAEEAKQIAAKKDKTLPWNAGALLAEARAEFGENDKAYGQWIYSEISEKISGYDVRTLNNYKNLSINFGHLYPEILDIAGPAALYKLNDWAKENPGMTLEQVKAKLAEAKTTEAKPSEAKPSEAKQAEPKSKQYGWRSHARAVGFPYTSGWDWGHLKEACKALNPALTFEQDDAENLQAVLEQVYANEHPEEAEAEADQAVAEFLEHSAAKDPVKTVEQIEAKLRKKHAAQAQAALAEALAQYRAELEAEVEAKYADLYEQAEMKIREAEEMKKGVYEAKQAINFFMTKAEWKLLISCCHPDPPEPASKDKKDKAMAILNRFVKVFRGK